MGERDGNGSGAGADVEDLQRRGGINFREHCFDEMLRFGTRDEDCGRDVECEAVELLLAGDVLDGLVGEAAEDEALVMRLLVGREDAGWVGVELCAGDSECVQEQQQRVAGGAVAQVWGRVELGGGAGEGFAEGVVGCQLSVLRF